MGANNLTFLNFFQYGEIERKYKTEWQKKCYFNWEREGRKERKIISKFGCEIKRKRRDIG